MFPIVFTHQYFYHTALSTELSFRSDIEPSFDEHAFIKLSLFVPGDKGIYFFHKLYNNLFCE